MARESNNRERVLLGFLNFVTFLISIPFLIIGTWLSKQSASECERFHDTPLIVLGVFLMLFSLAGLFGACFRITWLVCVYILATFLLILLLSIYIIFLFNVTKKGAGENLSGKNYKEYRLGDYSNFLQKHFNNPKSWNRKQTCLQDINVCKNLIGSGIPEDQFYFKHLSSVESGCCKPSNDCGFEYVSPTNWNQTGNSTIDGNPDCKVWRNDESFLCYGCDSCKAGLLDSLKRDWKKVERLNVVFIVFLIIVYSIYSLVYGSLLWENLVGGFLGREGMRERCIRFLSKTF